KWKIPRRGGCPHPPGGAKLRPVGKESRMAEQSLPPEIQPPGELRSPARTRASGPTWFYMEDCVPGCLGAYFEAHLACSCLACKTPSRPKLPSARAWELSLKVSGGASVP